MGKEKIDRLSNQLSNKVRLSDEVYNLIAAEGFKEFSYSVEIKVGEKVIRKEVRVKVIKREDGKY